MAAPTFLFSFDFDGTLVDEPPHPTINPGLNGFLESVQTQGGVWAVNTGRTLFQALDGIAEHKIRPLPDFIMAKERELYAPTQFNRWVDVGDWNKRCQKEHRRFLKTHRKLFKRVRAFLEAETSAQWIEESLVLFLSGARDLFQVSKRWRSLARNVVSHTVKGPFHQKHRNHYNKRSTEEGGTRK